MLHKVKYAGLMELEDETTTGGEYYTRDKCGRVYYYDSRRWYTAAGVHYCTSDIDRECVSIVRAG